VKSATIIPLTSQNLPHRERVMRDFAVAHVSGQPDHLRKETERIIRSYDPCISCSAHLATLCGKGGASG
jgi:sulfhydrogenase subunit alpha